MAPTSSKKSYTLEQMTKVVDAIGEFDGGSLMVNEDVDAPSTQKLWRRLARNMNQRGGTHIDVQEIKKIWLESQRLTLEDTCLRTLQRKVQVLLNKLPVDPVTDLRNEVNRLSLKLQKVEKDLNRLKKATVNQTIVVVSDESDHECEPSESSDTSTNASSETSTNDELLKV